MSKTTKIILSVSVVLIIIVLGALAYAAYQEQQGGESFISALFPETKELDDTNQENTPNNTDNNLNEEDTQEDNQFKSKIFKITDSPVVGYTIIDNNTVRYMEKRSGNIYDYNISTKDTNRVSNKTLDRIQKIIWGKDGKEFITQKITENGRLINKYFRFDNNNTYTPFKSTLSVNETSDEVKMLQKLLNEDPETLVSASGPGSPGEETKFYGGKTKDAVKRFQEKYREEILDPQGLTEGTGVFDEKTREKMNSLINEKNNTAKETRFSEAALSRTIYEITPSPDKSSIFYLLKNEDDTTSGIVANFDNSSQEEVFNSPFTEWLVDWNKNGEIILTTKPSENVPGNAYRLNVNNGVLTKIIGNINGITINKNSNNSVFLYSAPQQRRNGVATNIYNEETNSSEFVPFSTLSEKCVWSNTQDSIVYCAVPKSFPVGKYPDDWYKGKLKFSDNIIMYDTNTRAQNVVIDPETSILGNKIDVFNIAIDENDSQIIFMNKNDSSLWGVFLD